MAFSNECRLLCHIRAGLSEEAPRQEKHGETEKMERTENKLGGQQRGLFIWKRPFGADKGILFISHRWHSFDKIKITFGMTKESWLISSWFFCTTYVHQQEDCLSHSTVKPSEGAVSTIVYYICETNGRIKLPKRPCRPFKGLFQQPLFRH